MGDAFGRYDNCTATLAAYWYVTDTFGVIRNSKSYSNNDARLPRSTPSS
jgi:hypothetical protein